MVVWWSNKLAILWRMKLGFQFHSWPAKLGNQFLIETLSNFHQKNCNEITWNRCTRDILYLVRCSPPFVYTYMLFLVFIKIHDRANLYQVNNARILLERGKGTISNTPKQREFWLIKIRRRNHNTRIVCYLWQNAINLLCSFDF